MLAIISLTAPPDRQSLECGCSARFSESMVQMLILGNVDEMNFVRDGKLFKEDRNLAAVRGRR